MGIINGAIILFIVLETANVCILYFAPQSKLGNGVAIFNPWFELQKQPELALFATYMSNWVAGTKLIFIGLLLVILLVGNALSKVLAVVVMIVSIATYFWRLHPIIKQLDAMGEISPEGYSKTLGNLIFGFIAMFCLALLSYFIL